MSSNEACELQLKSSLERSPSSHPLVAETKTPNKAQGTRMYFVCSVVVFLVGITLIIAAVILIDKNDSEKPTATGDVKCPTNPPPETCPTVETCQTNTTDPCAPSLAANSGFIAFLRKVQNRTYELHPNDISSAPGADQELIRDVFVMMDFRPEAIKSRTDEAIELLAEAKKLEKKLDMNALRPREKKALQQVKHFLKHIFGQPYDANFYVGDWMMGPNIFCWQPVCYLGSDVSNLLKHWKPKMVSDGEKILEHLKSLKSGVEQYEKNMIMGVKRGMVRSIEECEAGLNAFKRSYFNISIKNDEAGVLESWFTRSLKSETYFSNINNTEEWSKWETKYNKTIKESLDEYLKEYVGKPIIGLIEFLENTHMSHCVPSNVSSGLGSLPVDWVYVNGTASNTSTNKTLPLVGTPLNGSESYTMLLTYFTSTAETPEQVHDKGWEQLNKFYPEVVSIARKYTNKTDNNSAIMEFKNVLTSSEMYFDDQIPANESSKEAYKLCSTSKGAKEHCPKRWKAMQEWFNTARMVMSMLDPKTRKFFHFAGERHTTPNCPIDLTPDFNPSVGYQSYQGTDLECSETAFYNIPFFLERMGPKFEEWSVNAHEARPGHHTQIQGWTENFFDTCDDVIKWVDQSTSFTVFVEGWALYGENPLIAQETDTYEDDANLLYKYGMYKWQAWRALRLIVDTGLHYYGYSRDWALGLFEKYAWDTDKAKKEVTRYQSSPGQATAYMTGRLKIIELRELAEKNWEQSSTYEISTINFSHRDSLHSAILKNTSRNTSNVFRMNKVMDATIF